MNKLCNSKLIFGSILACALTLFGAASTFAEEATTAESDDANAVDVSDVEIPAIWLQLSPVSNRVTLNANETTTYTFTVENIGTEAFDYKVYATPYSATSTADTDYSLDFSSENKYTQITRWISFKDATGNYVSTATFHVNVGEKQTIEYQITTPESIPAGGQYATIFAESINDNVSESGIKTISRVGLVVYGQSTGETIQEASITEYDFSKFILSGDLEATATVKNSGNTDFSANYAYTIKSLFGDVIYEDSVASYILPESERRVDMKWEDTPTMGVFQATFRVSAASVVNDESSVVIIMPIWVLIIALLLLTAIVIWIIILIRKQKERKSRLVA